jgi:chorismate mutase
MNQELEELRHAVRRIDQELVHGLAKRHFLTSHIAALKQRLQLPPRDFEVEQLVQQRARDWARGYGLEEKIADDFIKFIIERSLL